MDCNCQAGDGDVVTIIRQLYFKIKGVVFSRKLGQIDSQWHVGCTWHRKTSQDITHIAQNSVNIKTVYSNIFKTAYGQDFNINEISSQKICNNIWTGRYTKCTVLIATGNM